MSRAAGLLRAFQRLPGASFVEAAPALRAALSSGSLTEAIWKDAVVPQQGFSSHGFNIKTLNMPFSMAAQMHTLSRSEEENKSIAQAQGAAISTPAVPQALTLLPPRPKMPANTAARRNMAAAAGGVHLEMNQTHPFHVLPPSPWPFLAGLGCLTTLSGMAGWFHGIPGCGVVMGTGVASLAVNCAAWWRDCIIESDMGMHTEVQKQNLMNAIWLFIVSEAALFFGLLWACVHLGMSPSVWVHMQWPPVGVEAIGWEGRAMVMSAVLAASYYSANVALVAKDPKVVMGALGTTIGLGFLFLADQYLEYTTAPFTLTDSSYGSTFFITTGFHGFHVLVGSLWLLASMLNYRKHDKPTVSLKGSVLYWHFVDIVWIAVYGIIYAAQL